MFGKSRQAFHQMETRRVRESVNEELVVLYVKEIRSTQPRIGTRKLLSMLSEVFTSNNIKLGRDKLFRVLKNNDLLVKRRRRFARTTNSNHGFKRYPNLIEDYIPCGPEQICVCDITYLETEGGFVYLSLVTDQYSKKIMGYYVHDTLERYGPLKALEMALKNRVHMDVKLIHHSDQGIQYCCKDYIEFLEYNQIIISMSSKGNPYENAVAERVNGILKAEFYLDRTFKSIAQVNSVLKEVIPVYNTKRPHASNDYLTPEQAHMQVGVLKKRWKNYKPKDWPKQPVPIKEDVIKAVAQLLKKYSDSGDEMVQKEIELSTCS